jgi:hypothetical protein
MQSNQTEKLKRKVKSPLAFGQFGCDSCNLLYHFLTCYFAYRQVDRHEKSRKPKAAHDGFFDEISKYLWGNAQHTLRECGSMFNRDMFSEWEYRKQKPIEIRSFMARGPTNHVNKSNMKSISRIVYLGPSKWAVCGSRDVTISSIPSSVLR